MAAPMHHRPRRSPLFYGESQAMRLPIRCAAFFLAIALGLASPARAQMGCDPCTIGLVLDGPWDRNDEVRSSIEDEIVDLVGADVRVVFPAEKRLVADWSLDGARAAVERLLADPEVDILLTSGPVASTYAARRAAFPKPVVAAFVLSPEVQGIPVVRNDQDDRVSGVANLNYVTFPGSLVTELLRFREVVPFRHVTLLVSEAILAAIPELADNIRRGFAALDMEFALVQVGTTVDPALGAIPAETEAVFVVPLIQLSSSEFDRLVAELAARKLPSFSYWGRSEVERGLLTSIYLDTDFRRLGRRVALNVQRILRGEDAGAIPVDFRRGERLTLNLATARAIGAYPSWSVITEAELLDDERRDVARRLDLPTAAREAVAANLDVRTADRFVAAGTQAVRAAKSALYPQVSLSSRTQVIDKDRAEVGFGSQPQRLYLGSVGVSQLLYSDAAGADVDIQEQLQASREQTLQQTRLDTALAGAVAYLNVLRAKTVEQIQRENFTVTRSNLELADVRQRIGVARRSEVIRWENQIANNRRDVIAANAQRNIAEMELNRLLNRPLEEPFETADVDLASPSLLTTAARLEPFVGNPVAFDIFREFMTQEGLALAPELRQLDATVRAQERAVLAADRAFWAPIVALEGEVSGTETGGPGSGVPDLGLPLAFSRPNGFNWTIGVSASLPIFTGGGRRAERQRLREELAERRIERRASAERIEQRLRSALHQAGASYAAIELAELAADAAHGNLALVTDAYEQGAVPILDLLDAQNAALVADQVAASSVYDYLIDLMQVQRAVGRFDFFMTSAEYQEFLERLRAFFAAAGYQGRT